MEIKTAGDLLTASAMGVKKKKTSVERVAPVTMIRTTLRALAICQHWLARPVQL